MKSAHFIKGTAAVSVVILSIIILMGCLKPFRIEGQWEKAEDNCTARTISKDMKEDNTIIFFNGSNCNFSSPFETYRFQKIKGSYFLTISNILYDKVTFRVNVLDNDHIEISGDGAVVKLERIAWNHLKLTE